jgi:hypothetical protein
MTLRGVGNAGPRGGPRGDVLVVFDVKEDPRFERDGEDLYCEVLVTFPQLVFGGDVTVPTINGTVNMRMSPGTASGQVMHLRGRGLPRVNGSGTGDLHVRVQLWTPDADALTDEERALVRRLGELAVSPPRQAREKGFWTRMREALLGVTWFSLRVESPAHRDEAMAALFAAGAQGVHEEGAALATSFAAEADARAAMDAVKAVDPMATCDVRATPSVDWSVAWRDQARVVTLGRLAIAPPWLTLDLDEARTIVIDPGMAFGTGDHASTRGAVLLLQEAVKKGVSVADLGSGSAVLSIAAAKLGATRVWAIEIDPEAQTNAAEMSTETPSATWCTCSKAMRHPAADHRAGQCGDGQHHFVGDR